MTVTVMAASLQWTERASWIESSVADPRAVVLFVELVAVVGAIVLIAAGMAVGEVLVVEVVMVEA